MLYFHSNTISLGHLTDKEIDVPVHLFPELGRKSLVKMGVEHEDSSWARIVNDPLLGEK